MNRRKLLQGIGFGILSFFGLSKIVKPSYVIEQPKYMLYVEEIVKELGYRPHIEYIWYKTLKKENCIDSKYDWCVLQVKNQQFYVPLLDEVTSAEVFVDSIYSSKITEIYCIYKDDNTFNVLAFTG